MIGIYIDTPAFDEVTMDQASTFTDRLSTVGGTFGLLTGFSLISGVEIFYFLTKFLISLLSRKKKFQEYLQKVANFGKSTTSDDLNGSIEDDSLTIKNLVERNKNLEDQMKMMSKSMKILQSDLEIVQMREKQAEFGDSNAGAFFDAIFSNKIEHNKAEEDNQSESTP